MNPTDEVLASEAAAGSRDAFTCLVDRFGGAVLGVLERQVGDHHVALDLCQEVWIKAFRAIDRWKPAGSFRSWLFSIALNHLRDARRRDRRSRVVYLDEFRESGSAPGADPAARAPERAAIEAALEAVPEPFRLAVQLVDVAGLSYDEAAQSLGCAVGTIKSRVNRGRLAFRDSYLASNDDVESEVPRRQPGAMP